MSTRIPYNNALTSKILFFFAIDPYFLLLIFPSIHSNQLEVVNGEGNKFYIGTQNKNYCKELSIFICYETSISDTFNFALITQFNKVLLFFF